MSQTSGMVLLPASVRTHLMVALGMALMLALCACEEPRSATPAQTVPAQSADGDNEAGCSRAYFYNFSGTRAQGTVICSQHGCADKGSAPQEGCT